MKKIIAVRHAESIGNAGMATADPGSNPLTPKGEEQALHAAQIISMLLEPQLFIASKYMRTQQTLEPLRERFPHVPVEIWDIHEFCLLNPAHYSNTTPEDRRPHVLEYWEKNDPLHCGGGEAECFVAFMTRVETAVQNLQSHPCQNIVMFSHELVLKAINFLKAKTNFRPLKDESVAFQKEIMREFETYNLEHRIQNASPYLLDL
jgi:2,3-bisphosphoglycerate-dependent phosphoglycerate mutase